LKRITSNLSEEEETAVVVGLKFNPTNQPHSKRKIKRAKAKAKQTTNHRQTERNKQKGRERKEEGGAHTHRGPHQISFSHMYLWKENKESIIC
jgi:epoxyqueuosine reductase QueG